MCRLFAQVSPEASLAEKFLASGARSLLKQSNHDKARPQKDGWGIGFFTGRNIPVVLKSAKPAFKEPQKFVCASALAHSQFIIGHIRAASNPKGLSSAKLISKINSQPFTDGKWIFAHNGTLEIPDAVADRLGPLAKNIKSVNDSEVYFWQFIKHYRKTRSAVSAIRACVKETWTLWTAQRGSYPQKQRPYTSLNALISDGRALYAFCHSVKNPAQARSSAAAHALYSASQPWTVMSWSRRGSKLLIASEDMDKGFGNRFQNGEIMTASIEKGKVSNGRHSLGFLPELAQAPAAEAAPA